MCRRFFASIDERDRERFEDCLAPTVVTDFTALWGGEPVRSAASDLSAGWSRLFRGFVATQHLLGGYTLAAAAPADHEVTLHASFQATHRGVDPFGSPTWTLHGTYRIGLDRPEDRPELRIAGVYQRPTFGTGNRNIVLQAAGAAASGHRRVP